MEKNSQIILAGKIVFADSLRYSPSLSAGRKISLIYFVPGVTAGVVIAVLIIVILAVVAFFIIRRRLAQRTEANKVV